MLAPLPEALGRLWASHRRKHLGEVMPRGQTRRAKDGWLNGWGNMWEPGGNQGGTRLEPGDKAGWNKARNQVRTR